MKVRDNAENKVWERLRVLNASVRQRGRGGGATVGLLGCMAERLKVHRRAARTRANAHAPRDTRAFSQTNTLSRCHARSRSRARARTRTHTFDASSAFAYASPASASLLPLALLPAHPSVPP